jgi:hypothetical protein
MRAENRLTKPTRRHLWRTLCAVTVVGVSLSVAGPAIAAKPGSTSTMTGSCAVNPNPVAVGAGYTLTGSNLGAYALVNVLITDSAGTTSWNLQADASGTTSVYSYAYWSGTNSVKFLKSARHGTTTVAACSFSVS